VIAVEPVKAISQLTQVILDEPNPDLLLSHIALNTLDAISCREIELGLISSEGFIDIIARYGSEEVRSNSKERVPLWTSLPITDAARTGEIIYFDYYEKLVSQYPLLKKSRGNSSRYVIAAPIKYRHTVIGAVYLNSSKPPRNVFRESEETETLLGLLGIFLKSYLNKSIEIKKDYVAAGSSLTPR